MLARFVKLSSAQDVAQGVLESSSVLSSVLTICTLTSPNRRQSSLILFTCKFPINLIFHITRTTHSMLSELPLSLLPHVRMHYSCPRHGLKFFVRENLCHSCEVLFSLSCVSC